jgi:bifunctional UDP-N-acetylglucosamine pyrophosphorylase/glucosamine-1-phosphate N-acetyltransferase
MNKYKTIVKDEAFIGCNVNLVAPIEVGREAYIAAGSTINRDVPDGAFAIARERQVNKDEFASKLKAKRKSQNPQEGN